MLTAFRVRAFEPEELQTGLKVAVLASASEMTTRYYPSTVRRLGGAALDGDEAIHAYVSALLAKDQADDFEGTGSATYALEPTTPRADGIKVVGLATNIKNLPVRAHRFPLPPAVTDRFPEWLAGKAINLGRVSVTAWAMPEYARGLGGVYGQLLAEIPGYGAFTLEPVRSDRTFHEGIIDAGMEAFGDPRRYNIDELASVIPPVCQAYVRPSLWQPATTSHT